MNDILENIRTWLLYDADLLAEINTRVYVSDYPRDRIYPFILLLNEGQEIDPHNRIRELTLETRSYHNSRKEAEDLDLLLMRTLTERDTNGDPLVTVYGANWGIDTVVCDSFANSIFEQELNKYYSVAFYTVTYTG